MRATSMYYPLMLEMKNKIEQDIHNKIFEPNDEIGKVYKYFSCSS